MKQVNILADQKLLRKFCKYHDRDFGCRKAFGCDDHDHVCPVQALNAMQYNMMTKNMEAFEAYRCTQRVAYSEEEAKAILRIYSNPLKPYPEKMPEENDKDTITGTVRISLKQIHTKSVAQKLMEEELRAFTLAVAKEIDKRFTEEEQENNNDGREG